MSGASRALLLIAGFIIVTNSFTRGGETSEKWLAENQKCARVWLSFFCSALMFSESDSSTWKTHNESVKR